MQWQCGDSGCCRLYEGKETAEFQCSLQRFFLSLNQLMKSPLEGPTLLSQVWRGASAAGGLSSGAWRDGRCRSGGGTGCARAGVTPAVLHADLLMHRASKGAVTQRGALFRLGTPTCAPGAKAPEAPDHKTPHCAGAGGPRCRLGSAARANALLVMHVPMPGEEGLRRAPGAHPHPGAGLALLPAPRDHTGTGGPKGEQKWCPLHCGSLWARLRPLLAASVEVLQLLV